MFCAELRDIVAEKRIVSTTELFANDALFSVTLTTVEFCESDGKTQLVLTEQGVYLDGHETAAQREEGTRSMLDSLAAFLAPELR
jgi:hypothetical protein